MSDMSSPRGAAAPNPYSLYRVRGTKRQRTLILSDTWLGVESHYVSKQSVICAGEGNCEVCAKSATLPRWRGYVMAQLEVQGRPIVTLEFTARCFEAFRRRLSNHDTLRGHVCYLWRLKDTVTSPMSCQFGDEVLSPQHLAPVPDIAIQVARVYGVKPELLARGLPAIDRSFSCADALEEGRQKLKLRKP